MIDLDQDEQVTIEENGRIFTFLYNQSKGLRLTKITEGGQEVGKLTFPHFLIPWDKAREELKVQP